ncbi:hypothetical protein RND81_08G141700 [Saponaria officinalis]|uniref:Ubiquitin carboxyl-terminal hydrolase n=1 Tax=Saponaria officinalis TaxID=3572 RepID=A0AAW1J7K9_SAPOF
MCSSLVEEDQTLINSTTLICAKSAEIKPVEVKKLSETMAGLLGYPSIDRCNSGEIIAAQVTETLVIGEIAENAEDEKPVLGFSNSGESSGGCSTIVEDNPQIGKTLEEIPETNQSENSISDCGEIGGSIDSPKFAKTLEKTPKFAQDDVSGVEDVHELAESADEDIDRFRRPYYMEGERQSCRIYGPRIKNTRNDFMDNEDELYRVGAGLYNLGNTCFMNVVMQCFTHTVPLVQLLLSLKNEASCHGNDEFCVLCAVRHQIEDSLAFSGKIISPSNLVDNLSNISSCFQRYQQEDAHEFLQCLLDKLDNNWSKHESSDSLVKQVFGGRLVSQLRCRKCGYHSDNYEPMNDLSLEIDDVDDLESAFKSFTKVENLEDTTICDRCNEKVQREKRLLLDQAPPVAAFHLKRFKSDGFSVEKIDKMVEYPLELDLSPYTKDATDDNEKLKYELYGFVVHVGFSSTSGHYYCYIRTSPDEWHRFDDSKVTKVCEKTALNQEAYILFYARKGTPWFSGLLDKWKAQLEAKSSISPKSVLESTNLPSTSFHVGAFDERDATAVIDAEPLCCVRPDDVDMHDHTAAQEPSTCVNYGEDVAGENKKDETGKINLEKLFESDDENQFPGEPKVDVKFDLSTPDTPGSPGLYTDNDEEPTTDVSYQIQVAHIKSQKKASASSAAKKTVRDAKQDMERKEAAKYVKTSSMPIGRRQMLMAAINSSSTSDKQSKKRRKQSSSLTHKHTPSKRVKISPKRRAVAANV